MSQEDVDEVRRGYELFTQTGRFDALTATEDFVWDMSHFTGWPEQQLYEGRDGAQSFLDEWVAAWDDWQLDLEELHDAGAKVVAVMRQRGRSKTTGMPVDMSFAQVWTMRDGKRARMEMYSDPNEALRAVGLGE
jgi:ketosteroid isomerase-like protein